MVMFEDTRRSKKKLLGLTSALELGMGSDDMGDGFMLTTAEQLKQVLKGNHLELSGSEKVRIVKSVCRAKARAYRHGQDDDYKTYRALSTISSDVVRML